MPFNLNKVLLAGTMTRDIDLKFTPKGTAVGQLSLAVNRRYSTDNGVVEKVTFVDCEAWGKTAELIKEHCGKGHTIFVEGRLEMDSWEDKETHKKRTKMKVVIDRMSFVSRPKDQQGGGEEKPERPQQKPKPPPDPDLDQPEDDIPF